METFCISIVKPEDFPLNVFTIFLIKYSYFTSELKLSIMQSLSPVSPEELGKIFERITNLSDQAFFMYDVEKNEFLYLTKAFNEMVGMSKEEVNKNPESLFHAIQIEDQAYVLNEFRSFLNDRSEKIQIEFRVKNTANSLLYLRVSAYSTESADKKPLISGFIENLTTQKSYLDYVHKVNANKNATLSILAHDLKSPLGNAQMLIPLVKEFVPREKEKEASTVLKILESTNQRAIDIINSFVNQEFLESVEVGLVKRRIDLAEKIKEVYNQYKQNESYLHKTFILNKPNGDFFVEVDEIKFLQVINNLISNALKFTVKNGKIEIDLKKEKDHVVISVADNGIGIPEKFRPYLFDKFTRARRVGQSGEKPMGLGMSIIKTIVELHQGTIWYESEEGKGTTFYIRIPQ